MYTYLHVYYLYQIIVLYTCTNIDSRWFIHRAWNATRVCMLACLLACLLTYLFTYLCWKDNSPALQIHSR